MDEGITIIIPTCDGGPVFFECLQMIRQQVYDGPIQLMVVDSGSSDRTPELAESMGAVVKHIKREDFHHARTRNAALAMAAFDQVLFMVQDAVPVSEEWLSRLTAALHESGAAAVYTDQIPHDTATLYARFETESISQARGDQPVMQQIASLESFQEMPYDRAYRTINLDNVCAIYRKELLVSHPFPETAFAEDMAWALQMLFGGWKILYHPDIKVRHSHNRTPEYGFRRQIINSVWAARIMNRTETDLSFLKVRDLIALTARTAQFVEQQKAAIPTEKGKCGRKGKGRQRGLGQMLRASSLENRMMWLLYQGIASARFSSAPFKAIGEDTEGRIQSIVNAIIERYHPTDMTELAGTLDQVSANTLGRIYGETYASCIVNGKIPSEIVRLMRPFMSGV